MHNLCFFYYFSQKSLFIENYFLIAAINLANRGPMYTCLVYIVEDNGAQHLKQIAILIKLLSY